MSPDSSYPYGLEAQVAVLTNEVKALRRELEALQRLLERDVQDVRRDVQILKDRKLLDEHGIREMCREVVNAEAAGDTSVRDTMIRFAQFGIAIITVIFVLRGGR